MTVAMVFYMLTFQLINFFFKTKYSILSNFFNVLDKFSRLKTQKKTHKKKKSTMYNTTSELYNEFLRMYFDKYYDVLDAKSSKIVPKYDPINLTLDACNCGEQYKKELDDSKVKSDEAESYNILPLDDD